MVERCDFIVVVSKSEFKVQSDLTGIMCPEYLAVQLYFKTSVACAGIIHVEA